MGDDMRIKPESDIEAQPVGYLSFYDARTGMDVLARYTLWENQIFRVGRDSRSNDLTILFDTESMVSRQHCEVYAVVNEPCTSYHVYVRDRKSINGTFVNGQLIGAGPELPAGYLLNEGDVIEIQPYWNFKFEQVAPILQPQLTRIQQRECELFRDKYVLTDRCLGQGAEATVYLALQPTTGKQLVCKVVNLDEPRSKTKPEVRRRKFQETDILRQLRHPNILAYVDAFSSPHSLYTFTELASGGDLWAFMYRHDFVVKELDSRIIIRQVVRGLQYLHQKGIVHRDLKPENILLAYSPKASCHRILLSDFGASAVSQRNRMRTLVGTAGYQAPEQWGHQLQTETTDMWSLGIVALALIATIDHATLQELNQINQTTLTERIDAIISKRKTLPSENGSAFVKSCLQVSPAMRLKANDAARHDWLCTPKKHLDFFLRLDKKMMEGFQVHDELRAIPWELPDVQ